MSRIILYSFIDRPVSARQVTIQHTNYWIMNLKEWGRKMWFQILLQRMLLILVHIFVPKRNHVNLFFNGKTAPQWVMASLFARFYDDTRRRNTVGRIPADEWSARRRDLYLKTHNTHNRQTPTPPVGFEPTISAAERPIYSCTREIMLIFFYGKTAAQWAMASLFARFLDHTQRRITVGRTPLDEWSARRTDLYLPTHKTHNRQTPTPPVWFEPTISAAERPQINALDRAATGTCMLTLWPWSWTLTV